MSCLYARFAWSALLCSVIHSAETTQLRRASGFHGRQSLLCSTCIQTVAEPHSADAGVDNRLCDLQFPLVDLDHKAKIVGSPWVPGTGALASPSHSQRTGREVSGTALMGGHIVRFRNFCLYGPRFGVRAGMGLAQITLMEHPTE